VGLGSSNISDETLSIINKSKHPKRGGIQGTKKEKPMSKKTKEEKPMSKKTKEPPKEGKPLWNIKFMNPSCCKKHIK
jgi:hypothetical protein